MRTFPGPSQTLNEVNISWLPSHNQTDKDTDEPIGQPEAQPIGQSKAQPIGQSEAQPCAQTCVQPYVQP